MAESSAISWTMATWNPWLGCDRVSPLCSKCYIDRVIRKLGREPWGEVYRTKTWGEPVRWQRKHAVANDALRVFTCSLSDFFHVKADIWRDDAWDVIRACPNLIFLILTKRPERIMGHLPKDWPFPNVWPGISVGCKQELLKMDALRRVPVHHEAVRWISSEPLLEDISDDIDLTGFGWVVTGGESGSGPEYLWNPSCDWRKEFGEPGRRLMRPEWAAKLRDKTKAANLPFLFKQATAWRSGEGANLLGRVWHEVPQATAGMPWASTAEPHEAQLWTPVQIERYGQSCAEAAANLER
jgi:protein gp37